MAQLPRTTPDGVKPQTIDDIVAALLALGIDISAARGKFTQPYNLSSMTKKKHF